MTGRNMDFLQALASLIRHGVEVDRAVTGLQFAREQGNYSLVTRFNSYEMTYSKSGWSITIN